MEEGAQVSARNLAGRVSWVTMLEKVLRLGERYWLLGPGHWPCYV